MLILKNKNQFHKKKIILVTSAFHMHRAKNIFEKENFHVIPFPVDFRSKKNYYAEGIYSPFKFLPNAQSLNDSSFAIREIIGRIYYKLFR